MDSSRLADTLVDIQVQEGDEDVPAGAGCVGLEEAVELTLRQDNDTRENVEAHVQELFFDVAISLFLFQKLSQLDTVPEDLNVFSCDRPLANDSIGCAAKIKGQRDMKLLRATADDILTLAVFRANARDTPVERIADCIDNRGLAGAGLAHDGEQ